MSDWTGQDYLNELAGRPAARLPASIGEIWNAEYERSGLDTISGVGKPYRDAVTDLETAIAGASGGMALTDYAFSKGVNLAGAPSPDRRAALLAQLVDTLPEEARKTIEPLKDVRKRAAEKAQKIEADANDVAGATYGLSGAATSFAAGIARMTADPFNLAAMVATAPIGGPLTGGAAKVIGRQALAGGVAQAAVEPFIQPARAELGLESGADRSLQNIAGAALGGGVVGGGILGLSALFRAGARTLRGPREQPAAPKSEALNFDQATRDAGTFSHEDFDPFDRGVIYNKAERGPVTPGDIGGPVNEFYIPSADDMAAASALAQRDHVIDDAAWITPKVKEKIAGIASTRDAGLALPIVNEDAIRLTSETATLRARDAELSSQIDGLPPGDAAAADRLARLKAVEQQLAGKPDAETARSLARRRDELLADATPEKLSAAAAPIEQRRAAGAERASIAARLDEIAKEQARYAANNLSSLPKAMIGQTEPIGRRPTASDMILHREMVQEAHDAIEAGRPADPRTVAERLRAEGVEIPDWYSAARETVDAPADVVTKHVTARGPSTARYRPHSLLEFIAANGGINAKDPLAADVLQSFGGENPFIPGFGRLIRNEGKAVDIVREASTEAKYLFDPAAETGGVSTMDTNTLLAAIDEEARGNRQYAAGAEGTRTRAEIAAERESSRAVREMARADMEVRFDAKMQELQITDVKTGMRKRALQLIEREGYDDPLLAYERALMEYEDKQHAIRQARNASNEHNIPGWDVPDDAGPTSQLGGETARGQEPPGSGGSGEPARTDRGGAGPALEGNTGGLAGDPVIKTEAARVLDAHGGDVEIILPDENGNLRPVSAREAMRAAEDDALGAAEFKNCIGNTGGAE